MVFFFSSEKSASTINIKKSITATLQKTQILPTPHPPQNNLLFEDRQNQALKAESHHVDSSGLQQTAEEWASLPEEL